MIGGETDYVCRVSRVRIVGGVGGTNLFCRLMRFGVVIDILRNAMIIEVKVGKWIVVDQVVIGNGLEMIFKLAFWVWIEKGGNDF